VVPGSGTFTLTVYGANFVSGAVVNWNRSPRTTTFISARELQAQILASDVSTAAAGYITVTNPRPGGGVSSASYGLVEVHTPTDTISAKRPYSYLQQRVPWALPLADFNNDGILDFAAQEGVKEMEVRLGNGDGTLRFGSIATNNAYSGSAVASGDFNNDGNEDLVFGADWDGPPTQLQVSLGNGDGTFRKGSRFWHFNVEPLQIAVGDFNGDGNLDLITIGSKQITENAVFLGNGDGTFKHLVDYFSVGSAMAIGDFNGDGILDLALLGDDAVYIMLGKGDGRFKKPKKIFSAPDLGCGFGPPILVTDFNADGKSDLAFCERRLKNGEYFGKIYVMLGNGDGTFKRPISYLINGPSNYGFTFAVGDFNSDGKTDLVANYNVTNDQNETDLYLGNDDGTFQHKKIVNLPGAPN
jgi:hypothetical protein